MIEILTVLVWIAINIAIWRFYKDIMVLTINNLIWIWLILY